MTNSEKFLQVVAGGAVGVLWWMTLMTVLALSGLFYENDWRSWLIGVGVPLFFAVLAVWGTPRINTRFRVAAWSFGGGMALALIAVVFASLFIH